MQTTPTLNNDWPATPTRQILQGPSGAIEAVLAGGGGERQRLGVICHPHSLHGGSMDNKVVTTLERVLRDAGCATLRFNFRGVGASEGRFDEGHGEAEDLAAVVEQARLLLPGVELLLAGFSFGSYVSARMAGAIDASLLISVAPPVGRFAFRELARPPCRWIVAQGDADELIEAAAVEAHFAAIDPPVEYLPFAGASHFFHGRLVELRERLAEHVGRD